MARAISQVSGTTKTRLLASTCLIITLGVLTYLPSLDVPFTFDDKLCIAQNSSLHDLDNLAAIWNYTPTRFAAMFSFALNYHFNGTQLLGYHLVNLSLHLGTALALLFFLDLLQQFIKVRPSRLQRMAAPLASLVFLLHPLQTQAVTYIWQRTALMATLGFILTLLFYLKMRLALANASPRKARGFQVLALLAMLLALFSKEIAFTLPLALLAIEILLLRPIQRPSASWWLPFALGILPIPLLVVANSGHYAETMPSIMEGYTPLTPAAYILTQARVIFTYLRLLLVPLHQQVDYDYPIAHQLSDVWLQLLGLILLAAAVLWSHKRQPLLCFALVCFFLGLAVETLAVTLPDVIFEHRMYLPMIGVCIAVFTLILKLKSKEALWIAVAVLLLAGMAGLSWQRNQLWRDSIALWTDNLDGSPRRARVWMSRALAYREQHQLDQALADVNQAIALNPAYRLPYVSRALILGQLDRHAEALPDFNQALEMRAEDSDIRNARGLTLLSLKHYELALADFEFAISRHSDWAQSYNYRGAALSGLDRDPEALEAFNMALTRDPAYADAYLNRAIVLARNHREAEAVADYQHFLELQPEQRQVYISLASLLNKLKRVDEAKDWLDRAVLRFPDYATARFNRAVLWHDRGAWPEALKDFSEALHLQPQGRTYYWRGTVYLKLGDRERAAEDFRSASSAGIALPVEAQTLLSQPP